MTNPFALLLWVLSGALSLVLSGVAVAVTVLLIRGALTATLSRKQDHP